MSRAIMLTTSGGPTPTSPCNAPVVPCNPSAPLSEHPYSTTALCYLAATAYFHMVSWLGRPADWQFTTAPRVLAVLGKL